jgi:hypothetical protein
MGCGTDESTETASKTAYKIGCIGRKSMQNLQ